VLCTRAGGSRRPGLSKSEKKRLCALMGCKKLIADTSAHGEHNVRLPLRVVVHVLFFFERLRQSTVFTYIVFILNLVFTIMVYVAR
jgi:hypothetical protein